MKRSLVSFRTLVLGLALAGCDANGWDPSTFSGSRNEAPVFVTPNPGGSAFPLARYGSVVAGYAARLPDRSVVLPGGRSPRLLASRYAVAGGASSPYFVWRGFEDRAIDATTTTGLRPRPDGSPLYDACRDREFCGDGASASLAAFPVLPGGLRGGGSDFGCIAAPAGSVDVAGSRFERLNVRCETEATTIRPLDAPAGIGFGASAVGLPGLADEGCTPEAHPVGLALFGAPGGHDGTGALYVLSPTLELREVAFEGLDLPPEARLGAEVAAAGVSDTKVLAAVSARSEEGLAPPQVIIASLRVEDGVFTTFVHACLGGEGASEGFGRALAIGDLDGDGLPEIAVGGGDRGEVRAGAAEELVQIFSAASLADRRLVGCLGDAPPLPDRTVACADVTGLLCAEAAARDRAPSGFGASLAIGDVNGDGTGDLVLGAPHARVSGVASGGVVSLAGGSSLAELGAGAGRQAIVAPSSAGAGMLFGFDVALVPGTDRDEIVAGAPGAASAALLFCSGLAGDRPADLAGQAGVSHGCVLPSGAGRPPVCSGGADAGTFDDAATLDAGLEDAGVDDAGVEDAGVEDAGVEDAGVEDAGVEDAG
jgi:hypothetical protein